MGEGGVEKVEAGREREAWEVVGREKGDWGVKEVREEEGREEGGGREGGENTYLPKYLCCCSLELLRCNRYMQ